MIRMSREYLCSDKRHFSSTQSVVHVPAAKVTTERVFIIGATRREPSQAVEGQSKWQLDEYVYNV